MGEVRNAVDVLLEVKRLLVRPGGWTTTKMTLYPHQEDFAYSLAGALEKVGTKWEVQAREYLLMAIGRARHINDSPRIQYIVITAFNDSAGSKKKIARTLDMAIEIAQAKEP